VQDETILAGTSQPTTFTINYDTFVYGDEDSIVGPGSVNVTPAYQGSPGNYLLTPSGLTFSTASNYLISYVPGTLFANCQNQGAGPSCGIGISFPCVSTITIPACLKSNLFTFIDQDNGVAGTQTNVEYGIDNGGRDLWVKTTAASTSTNVNALLGNYAKNGPNGNYLGFELCDVIGVGSGLHFVLNVVLNTASGYAGSDLQTQFFRDDFPVGTQLVVSLEFYDVNGVPTNLNCNDPNTLGTRTNMYLIDVYSAKRAANGVDETSVEQSLKIYPNPANGLLRIEAPGMVEIYNSTGQLVYSGTDQVLDVSQWARGFYIVRSNDLTERLLIN
jgi:hypothetical protein